MLTVCMTILILRIKSASITVPKIYTCGQEAEEVDALISALECVDTRSKLHLQGNSIVSKWKGKFSF
jgi:hypothetical protein